jgi:hypothetical protein
LEVLLLLLHIIKNEKSMRSSKAIGSIKNIDFKFICISVCREYAGYAAAYPEAL